MHDNYLIDLTKYSIDKFQTSLENRELIPSRVILKQGIQEKFGILQSQGIETLHDLIENLKTKSKLEQFSQDTGLSVDYLTILKREAGSMHPSPVPLEKFPDVSIEVVNKLKSLGIKNSKHLFYKTMHPEEMEKLSASTLIPIEALHELAGLSDLVRLYGVGPAFARILYDIGITSVKVFMTYSPEALVQLYEDITQKKADFSARDVGYSLELAKELEGVVGGI